MFTRGQVIDIPSPIDLHAHFREPGGTLKETIESGSRAAMFGGYALVLDMPNNPGGCETWTEARVREKSEIARNTAFTDIGIIAGHDFKNPRLEEYKMMVRLSLAVKDYLGHTTGNLHEYTIEDKGVWTCTNGWSMEARRQGIRSPHMLHAREEVGYEAAQRIMKELGDPVHWCHVSTGTEVNYVEKLQREFPDKFTSAVTGHHLTMTHKNADLQQGVNARMMPELGTAFDNDKLIWGFNKGIIDMIETDHAPHTEEESLHAEAMNPRGIVDVNNPDCVTCFGVSGIEFILPIMTALVQREVTTMERVVDAMHTQPLRMLGITGGRTKMARRYKSAKTTIEFDPWQITEKDIKGKSKNTPYIGFMAGSHVRAVKVNGVNRFTQSRPDIDVVTPQRKAA